MTTAQFENSVSAIADRSTPQQGRSFATMMVHVDVARDCEQRVQLALALAHRFEANLIGVAGMPLRPAFAAGGVVVYHEPTEQDYQTVSARLDEIDEIRAKGQHLKQVEWRAALELPYELVSREARAADLIIVGARHADGVNVHDLVDPGAILLRAGRPLLVAPDVVVPPQLRRVVVAWKDTRECRRAVRDALPFLQKAEDVLVVGIDEGQSDTPAKGSLSDVADGGIVLRRARCGGGAGRSAPNSFTSFGMRARIDRHQRLRT
jgi:nucleotide-binding universal stress UspA family protein